MKKENIICDFNYCYTYYHPITPVLLKCLTNSDKRLHLFIPTYTSKTSQY